MTARMHPTPGRQIAAASPGRISSPLEDLVTAPCPSARRLKPPGKPRRHGRILTCRRLVARTAVSRKFLVGRIAKPSHNCWLERLSASNSRGRIGDPSYKPESGERTSACALLCSAASRSFFRARARIGPTEFSGMPSCLAMSR